MKFDLTILHDLEQIASTQAEIRLFNVFHGLPISYPAVIQSFDETEVTFNIHKYQSVCLAYEKQTFIQSEVIPFVIKSRVGMVDITALTAVLTDFSRAPITIGGRTAVRVSPKEPVPVTICSDHRKIPGNLADISVDGVGVVLVAMYIYQVAPRVLKKDAPAQIKLRLPGETAETVLPGKVMYIKENQGSYRLGINTLPDAKAKQNILRFVSQRQAEIMREVKLLYEMVSQLKAGNDSQTNPR